MWGVQLWSFVTTFVSVSEDEKIALDWFNQNNFCQAGHLDNISWVEIE